MAQKMKNAKDLQLAADLGAPRVFFDALFIPHTRFSWFLNDSCQINIFEFCPCVGDVVR